MGQFNNDQFIGKMIVIQEYQNLNLSTRRCDPLPENWSDFGEKFPVRFGRYWTRDLAYEDVEI